MEHSNVWNGYTKDDLQAVDDLARGYIDFISTNKTERECVQTAVKMARLANYKSIDEFRRLGKKLEAGDKVYAVNDGKELILFQKGTDSIESGFNILGAHIDSPRLDIKQNPAYEADGLAYLDTHYYGGIKKYPWVTMPLAIHGVVAKKDGSVVNVNVGDDPADPVFTITDLLIHLADKQMKKSGTHVVEGEDLDVLVGSRPIKATKSDMKAAKDGQSNDAAESPVKALLIKILQDKYGFDSEQDFLSAELEVVPAGRARDCGFDRSMILGYGHDDRSCAYTSLVAQLDAKDLKRSAMCILTDKEEIGSVGATGMTSMFFENTVAELMDLACEGTDLPLRRALASSSMLSSDVSAALDPLYKSEFEPKNSAYFGHGLVFNKYTGSRGKSGSNDANAEYVADIRRVMEKGHVGFQTAELGKVDAGGGGTIAFILAKYGMDVIDCGVAVLSMHQPWEVVSKADLYEARKGYTAFLTYQK